MTDPDRAAILAEIVELSGAVLEVQPDEVTINDYRDAVRCSDATARRKMLDLVGAGKMTMREAQHEGRRCLAFRLVKS